MNNKSILFAALITLVGFAAPTYADPAEQTQSSSSNQEEPINPQTICDYEPACTID